MKISYLVTRANHGGAQVHLLELIGPLRSNHDIRVYTGETGYLTEQLSGLNVAWQRLPDLVHPISPLQDVAAVKTLRVWLEKQRPDVLHAHTAKAGLVGRMAAQASGTRCVYTPHGWTFSERSSWMRRGVAWPVEWACGRLPSWVVTVSDWEKGLGKKAGVMDCARAATIPHGISDSIHRHRRRRKDGRVRIVMVGRFERPKDQLSLLKAFSRLDRKRATELVFIGEGPTMGLVEQYAKGLKLNSVRFLGPRNDVDALLAEMDILVLASASECFGLCLLEAMRASLPVIATRVGAIPEVAVDGETGLLYEKGNLQELQSHLETLIGDPGLRASMGARGRLRFERKFTARQMVERTEKLYRQLAYVEETQTVAAAAGS